MRNLSYIVEDNTIAYLLGINNFTNDESAILELVKNSYDASAMLVILEFLNDKLIITDDGLGMNENDILNHWMHIGKSDKDYDIIDNNNQQRILAGSKGVGRFALARLGTDVKIYSKKKNDCGIIWETDWNTSAITLDNSLKTIGTKIIISGLREKWGKKKIQDLEKFLSKTYNDKKMKIQIVHPDLSEIVPIYFPDPQVGKNCLTSIDMKYNSKQKKIEVTIESDEFLDLAQSYCKDLDIKGQHTTTDMVDELKSSTEWDISRDELEQYLEKIGDFSAQFYFYIKPSTLDMEKFLYKYSALPENIPSGVILYRNAFSISSYEGKKDWLEFGKRSRKSPAAATHPTGSWRVRENQIAGKVEIDRKQNEVLQDLSNRQGLDENIYYQIFVHIILTGIKEFERYRQAIIRQIDVKNNYKSQDFKPISDRIASNPKSVPKLSEQEARQLVAEIKTYQKESKDARKEKEVTEKRYKYDIRILNVLATVGLKASSIAHEMRNDRNSIATNINNIIDALKAYDMWDELNTPEKTLNAYNNVPYLLQSNKRVCMKIVTFMNTMLSEIEKKQFEPICQSISDILNKIKKLWETDYKWVEISICMEDDIAFCIAEDMVQVVIDNLILNSIQQNEQSNHLRIAISVKQLGDLLNFTYSDDGKGLDKKYIGNPRKILEVHETTRKNGHGLGMWIIHNTTIMSGGGINKIMEPPGFCIEFNLGGEM